MKRALRLAVNWSVILTIPLWTWAAMWILMWADRNRKDAQAVFRGDRFFWNENGP